MRKITYLLLIYISIISCSDEKQETNTLIKKESFATDLQFDKFSNNQIKNNLILDWNSVKRTKIKDTELTQIVVEEKIKTQIVSNYFNKEVRYQILQLKNENNINEYFIEIFSNLDSQIYPNSISELDNFSGTFNVYKLNGSEVGSISILNGIAKCRDDSNLSLINLKSAINSFKTSATKKYPTCTGQTSFQPYTSTVYIDHYDIWTNANTGQVIATVYTGTTIESISSGYMEVITPCGEARDPISIARHSPRYDPKKGFPNKYEFEEVYNSTDPNAFNIGFDEQKDTFTAKADFKILPWAGIKVYIEQNKDTNYSIKNITSQSWGLTAGFIWKQDAYDHQTIKNITVIKLYGTFTYTIFKDGFGKLYEQPITYEIHINNTNGNIIAGTRI